MKFNVNEYLASFVNWEPRLDQAGVSSFSLERMEALLKCLGHPEGSLLFAHIAGSKGKGSTAMFLASILRAAGHRVGLYTSPHLYSYHERIRVLEPGSAGDGPFEGSISPVEFDALLVLHKNAIDRLRAEGVDITYYELMTALAVAYFAARGVKAVVLETGLGGRMDATNVFETSVCGITPLGMEHASILGPTLALIAAEKAAIIKEVSQRAVFAPQPEAAMAVLQARARRFGIVPTLAGVDMPVKVVEENAGGVTFDVSGRREYSGLRTRLAGAHQAFNAGVAIAMAEDLEVYGCEITEQAVRRGVSEARWPGRFEIFSGNPSLVIDSAHTRESAAACARTFEKIFPGRKAVLLFGISRDKDIAGVCGELARVAARVVTTKTAHPRAFGFSAQDLKVFFPAIEASVFPDTGTALAEAGRLAGRDGIILAAGSVFLAAEVRKRVSV